MDFKEVKAFLTGYTSYCEVMLGKRVSLKRNKLLKQFEIWCQHDKKSISECLITIETAEIKKNLIIYIKVMQLKEPSFKLWGFLTHLDDENIRNEFNGSSVNARIQIYDVKQLTRLFFLLEEYEYFGQRKL